MRTRQPDGNYNVVVPYAPKCCAKLLISLGLRRVGDKLGLGQREAATPAPVPKIDPVSGSSVYHAVTEANDLRVAIEPTRCADVMSGKPFEKTVTVTLNGQTYRGCGEAVQ